MHGPAVVTWLLAALTATSGTYCLSRLRGPSCERPGPGARHGVLSHESAAAEALMGLGTAAMAVSGGVVPPAVWAWVFGLPGAWFLFAALAPRAAAPRSPVRYPRVLPPAPLDPGVPGSGVPGPPRPYSAGPHSPAPHSPARRVHRLHHAIGALAMTYMALAMAGSPAHSHHQTGAGLPLLTGGLLLYFGGYTLWTGSRLLATPGGVLPTGTTGLPQACRLTMGIGMFAMLLTL
ncbi:DUF5134 domain-containing protein [Kitasatospora sp. NBC_00240]|uniref:DUF5134 domain-containing protein n=1 Tax=Kitasatospora sp. NBC_00240 TaxID=2903567 RepID=UPI00224DBD1C|nr:DUF5134 domain-containing protein [Kitasatospora sp. NBC_00240]MCX5213960.1 DUF5134 domain-containing protein [Kitasatospora sp. NBC_00240]